MCTRVAGMYSEHSTQVHTRTHTYLRTYRRTTTYKMYTLTHTCSAQRCIRILRSPTRNNEHTAHVAPPGFGRHTWYSGLYCGTGKKKFKLYAFRRFYVPDQPVLQYTTRLYTYVKSILPTNIPLREYNNYYYDSWTRQKTIVLNFVVASWKCFKYWRLDTRRKKVKRLLS